MDQKKSNKRVTEIIPFNFEDNKVNIQLMIIENLS